MILEGKQVCEGIIRELKNEIRELKSKPALAIVSVGNDPASEIYVKKKIQMAKEIGIESIHCKLGEKTTQKELLELIKRLNENKKINGFIVQLPLPKHINPKVIENIDPKKDVDGFHPLNIGKVFLGDVNEKTLVAATPLGIMKLIEHYKIEIEGKYAVVVGRSATVGRPISALLLNKNATVTICHSKTKNLGEITRMADILIVAVGRSKLITAEMVKKDAYVIDVGMNRDKNGKLTGDVDFENIIKKAHCTPVPGGIGPLTVSCLMYNVVNAAIMDKKD
ncbi:MAG: bifunctional 5,10-methylenetetrahydrofolate dehydrogenase/5,10-methenyltetrahydrofolate cyclohydrolase [Candidatus Micrarchaeia archaeon]